jgi:hypothetical protein
MIELPGLCRPILATAVEWLLLLPAFLPQEMQT